MELAAPFQDETGSNPVKECLSINIERTARPPAISSGALSTVNRHCRQLSLIAHGAVLKAHGVDVKAHGAAWKAHGADVAAHGVSTIDNVAGWG